MIKIENVEVVGWEHAIRGMRNPMNSWDKSDSAWIGGDVENDSYLCVCEDAGDDWYKYYVGDNDQELMKKLRNAGTDHRKFMRMITVYVDVTAPLYWWKEHDQYKVGTTTNSCSTMHKIHAKKFSIDDFSHEHLKNYGVSYSSFDELNRTIDVLNFWRDRFVESDEERQNYFNYNGYPSVPSKKECWWQMIQLLPSSYNQKRTVMLNYEVMANMYKSRKNHKLDEWREFCEWIKALPYSELITGEFKEDTNDDN